jgi:tRNA A37 threonylcarbamoyladenosine dehydratase
MDSKSKTGWNYNEAFSRNLGILSDTDQEVLRRSTVAIPGCGGVGGIHAQVLARLGVGGFNLVDFDQYEVANFNRQFGARTDSLGSNKVDVIEADVRNINPDARIRSWSEPLSAANVDAFLEGVDLVVDSLDFFAADARLALFEACERLSIPLITAAPLGFSTALLIFAPGSMSYKK